MARVGRPPRNTEMYNAEIKNRFIEEQYSNLDTQKRYKKLFFRTFEFENNYNKDIYNFTLDEVKDMIISLSSTSTATLNSTVSILRKYITWAINEKYVENPINVIELLDSDEIKKLISHVAQEYKYLKRKQDLINIINNTINPQDSICFILAYHGLKAEDILNLKIDDVKENKLYVGDRVIELEDRFIQVIHDAYNQTVYIKNNGLESNAKSNKVMLDTNSRYVIHGSLNSNRETKPTLQVVNNRIKRVIESFNTKGQKDLYTKLLTLVNVFYSGMFITLHELEEQRTLTTDDFYNIRVQYGLDGHNVNDTMNRYNEWKKTIIV